MARFGSVMKLGSDKLVMGGSVRGMATIQQLKIRISGTQNISKITKSMKMVSAAKLRGDQSRLQAVVPFQAWAEKLTGAEQPLEEFDVSHFPQNNTIVVCTTDKGLCGGVNTILSRMTRQLLAKLDAAGKNYQLVVLGEKGRSQLRRAYGDKIKFCVTERQVPYTFDLSSALAADILAEDTDAIHLLYNEFKSAISYIPSVKTIVPLLDPAHETLSEFDVKPRKHQDTLLNLFEFTLATQIFHSLLENATSEQSSRMGAMENASKNAAEMIDKLTLQYNRARQSRITTELIEIISGAAALDPAK